MTSKILLLLLGGLAVMGIYVLPAVVATFAGSHTMERNETAGVGGLMCMDCHTYILAELEATGNSRNVLAAHRNAANNSNYVGADKDLNITDMANATETVAAACHMCHMMEQDALNIDGSHTKITIRVCTDEDCHGSSTANGTSAYALEGTVGPRLSNATDAHSGWFDGMDTADSSYTNEDGGTYKAGFYACIACHTHGEMNMNISRPQAFNINITIDAAGTISIGGPTINDTVKNLTTSRRAYGSVWS